MLHFIARIAVATMLVVVSFILPALAQFNQQRHKLVGTGAVGAAGQGTSVALSADGNTVIVGGQADNSNAGAAWVFTRNTNGVWSQQGPKLVGAGAVGAAGQGRSVALSADGNTIIVGGPSDNSFTGAAWVFNRDTNGVWHQRGQKLVGTGAVGVAGQGASIALSADGNTAIVGGPFDDSGTGAAWVFNRNTNGVWRQRGQKLVGTGKAGASLQGASVALSADGNTAIVGGPSDNSNTGAAWVFNRNTNGVWQQRGQKLVGTGAAGVAVQGNSVALSGDGNTAVVGGYADNSNAGAAWVFVARPIITNVRPLSGPVRGGTAVLVKGRNFTGATAVNFGVSAARSFRVRDPRTIVAYTRRHAAGTVPVRVTTPAGKATRSSAFTFE